METIGNYKILKVILEKGVSRVCLAEHQKLGRKTLLKIYAGADSELIKRFEREARIVAELNHEAIVAIYDFGEDNGRFFISMAYVEGSNLADYLKANQLTTAEILDFAFQIAKSVAVLHRKGYIHRDLKPENILIDLNGKVKITDFGIALHDSLNRMTIEGKVLGTPLYMSPEQINNLPLTAASDVFAMGIIFYQIACGVNPFQAGRFGEVFSRILSERQKPVTDFNPAIPQWFGRVVDKMLSKEPEKRFQNASEIVKEFEKNRQISEQPAIAAEKKRRQKRLEWVVGIPLLLVLMVLFLLYGDQMFAPLRESDRTPLVSSSIAQDSLIQLAGRKPQFNSTDSGEVKAQDKMPDENESANSRPGDIENVNKKNPSENQVNEQQPGAEDSNNAEFANDFKISHIAAEEKLPEPTTFFIKTWPWCAVFLNRDSIDTTPMKSRLTMKPGSYHISLKNPNYPVWSDSILVQPGVNNEFSFDLDSLFFRLELQVDPWGEVYVDGNHVGTTPLNRPLYLSRKKHFLQVKNQYYQTWQDSIYWNGRNLVVKYVVLKAKKANELQ